MPLKFGHNSIGGATTVALFAFVGIISSKYGAFLPAPATGPAQILDKAFHAKMAPLEGVYTPNERLLAAERLFDGVVQGSETVAHASNGWLAVSSQNGSLYWAKPTSAGGYELDHKPFVKLQGGRPLGLHFDEDDNLLVCNAGAGLQRVAKGSSQATMVTARTSKVGNVPATPIKFANDLDVAPDGTIYFTDSSHMSPLFNKEQQFYDTLDTYVMNACQGVLSGRLLAYHPKNQKTTVVADGFLFSNGVAVAADGSFVAVVETSAVRIWKIWLMGEKAGRREVLMDSLPGFPDGISRSADGKSFWVGIVGPPSLLSLAMPYRLTRFLLAWAFKIEYLKKLVPQFGCVLQISPEGEVLQMLLDPTGSHVSYIPSVVDLGGRLILGNLMSSYVAVVDVSGSGAAAAAGPRPATTASSEL